MLENDSSSCSSQNSINNLNSSRSSNSDQDVEESIEKLILNDSNEVTVDES
jgi:hypothetical protein